MRCVASIEWPETEAIWGTVAPLGHAQHRCAAQVTGLRIDAGGGDAAEALVEPGIWHRPTTVGDDRHARSLAGQRIEMGAQQRVYRHVENHTGLLLTQPDRFTRISRPRHA
jgi:hypothetical protein